MGVKLRSLYQKPLGQPKETYQVDPAEEHPVLGVAVLGGLLRVGSKVDPATQHSGDPHPEAGSGDAVAAVLAAAVEQGQLVG